MVLEDVEVGQRSHDRHFSHVVSRSVLFNVGCFALEILEVSEYNHDHRFSHVVSRSVVCNLGCLVLEIVEVGEHSREHHFSQHCNLGCLALEVVEIGVHKCDCVFPVGLRVLLLNLELDRFLGLDHVVVVGVLGGSSLLLYMSIDSESGGLLRALQTRGSSQ